MSKITGKLKGSYGSCEFFRVEWKIHSFDKKTKFRIFDYSSALFSFAENKWRIKLYQLRNRWDDHMFMKIANMGGSGLRKINCKLGLKKTDGTIQMFPCTLDGDVIPEYAENAVIKKERLWCQRNEFIPGDVLTVLCHLYSNFPLSNQIAAQKAPGPLKLIKLDSLSNNLKSILTAKEGCDVIFIVEGREFPAHKNILMARSSVFASMFRHNSSGNQPTTVTVDDCDPDYFQGFLEYMYCGKLDVISFPSVLQLYSNANKYDVQELKSFCVEYMKQCLTPDNACDVLVLADSNDETELMSAAQQFFNENARQIIVSSKWENLLQSNFHLANRCMINMRSIQANNFTELDSLSNNLKSILTAKEGCDVIFRVEGKEFPAHKNILMALSSVFASMFRRNSSANQPTTVTVDDCDPDYFQEFLEYMYCGKLDEISFPSVLQLYSNANKYDVQELKSFCVDYMKQHLTVDNVCDVIFLADSNDETELMSAAQQFFNENAMQIMVSSKWENLLKSNSHLTLIYMTNMLQDHLIQVESLTTQIKLHDVLN